MAMMPFFTQTELAELINLTRERWGEQATPDQVRINRKLRQLWEIEVNQELIAKSLLPAHTDPAENVISLTPPASNRSGMV